jgi:hypothetical protein
MNDDDGQDQIATETQPDLFLGDVSAIPPSEFQQFDTDIPVEFQCPCCGYEWSGDPKP